MLSIPFLKYGHPVVLLSYFGSLLVLTTIQRNWFMIALLFFMSIVLWYCVRGKAIFKEMRFVGIMLIVVTITNPLFVSKGFTILYQNSWVTITLQSLIYGFVFGMLISTIFILCKIMRIFLRDTHLVYLFGSTLPILGLVVSMVFNLVDKFTLQYHKIKQANQLLYLDFSWRDKIHKQLDIFVCLIVWSFESSMTMLHSMHARGYGSAKRSHFHLYVFRKYDQILVVVIFLISGFCLYGYMHCFINYYYYPLVKPIVFTIEESMFFIGYILLWLVPIIVRKEG